jgi:hypothetical protein
MCGRATAYHTRSNKTQHTLHSSKEKESQASCLNRRNRLEPKTCPQMRSWILVNMCVCLCADKRMTSANERGHEWFAHAKTLHEHHQSKQSVAALATEWENTIHVSKHHAWIAGPLCIIQDFVDAFTASQT